MGAANWEEINAGQAGGNYGWPLVQGIGGNPAYINPVHVYDHNEGCPLPPVEQLQAGDPSAQPQPLAPSGFTGHLPPGDGRFRFPRRGC